MHVMMILPGNSACVQRQNNSKRLYYSYQSVWIAVDEEVPSQSLRAKSEDPFAVAATAVVLIVDCKKFSQFAQRFYDKSLLSY